jgi:hypothetical protein
VGWRCGEITWRECSLAEANTVVTFPGPTVMRFDAAGVVPTAVASVWSLVQLPRVASGRLGRCPIGCDRHQLSRVKGGFELWPSGRQLEARSTWASGRRGGGDQGPWAMIASTDPAITPKRATCGSSRLATRGLVAIGNKGRIHAYNIERE